MTDADPDRFANLFAALCVELGYCLHDSRRRRHMP